MHTAGVGGGSGAVVVVVVAAALDHVFEVRGEIRLADKCSRIRQVSVE
jgi:hypothetical protein